MIRPRPAADSPLSGKRCIPLVPTIWLVLAFVFALPSAPLGAFQGAQTSEFTRAATADTTPPTVSLTAPADGRLVTGTITISADASDNQGVAGVQFQVDGVNLGAEDTVAPYSVQWDTATVGAGNHTVTAVARDPDGNTASVSITVAVLAGGRNPNPITINSAAPADPYPSTIEISGMTAPVLKALVRLNGFGHEAPFGVEVLLVGPGGEDALLMGWVGSDILVSDLEFLLDDDAASFLPVGRELTSGTFKPTFGSSFSFFAAPAPIPSGVAQLSAFAGTDPNGTWSLYVYNLVTPEIGEFGGGWDLFLIPADTTDTDPPTVSMTAPAAGETLAGVVTVSAEAFDDQAVAGVQFKLDGVNLGEEDRFTPYNVPWNTTQVSAGAHTLTAVARDVVGNTTTSSAVIVDVVASYHSGSPITVANREGSDPYPAPLTVAGFPVPVRRAIVTFNDFSLTTGEIGVLLEGPTGADATILSGLPDNRPSNIDFALDDAATTPLPQFSPLVSGTYRPGSVGRRFGGVFFSPPAPSPSGNIQLSTYKGTDPNGTWNLWTTSFDFAGPGNTTATIAGGWSLQLIPADLSDVTPPVVSITRPVEGKMVAGLATVVAEAFDDQEVRGIQFRVDGVDAGSEVKSLPYGFDWDTTGLTGTHTVTAVAADVVGNTASADLAVTIAPLVTQSGAITMSDDIASAGPFAASPYPSTLTVSGVTEPVVKVVLTLHGFSHVKPNELDILLVGPTGANIFVMSDAGGTIDVSGLTLVFDDDAERILPGGGTLASGVFRPVNYTVQGDLDTFLAPAPTPSGTSQLAVFKGLNPNGTWSLYVMDEGHTGGTTPTATDGVISGGWSLQFVTALPKKRGGQLISD